MPMLKALMDYGAVAAKVRALYGRMLSPGDWARLRGMRSVQELSSFLRAHPGWREAAAALPPGIAEPRELEAALRGQLCGEYERLFKFASGQDKKFLLITLYRAEFSLILASLRRFSSVRTLTSAEIIPEFYIKKSASDLEGIKNARSFSQLLDAASGGIYADTLRALPKDAGTGLPDYREASVALENRCFLAIYSFIDRGYTGKKRDELIAYLGDRADAFNLTHLLRLRRFPASLKNAEGLLIPVRRRLKPQLVEELKNAPDDRSVLEILRRTPWSEQFRSLAPDALERQYNEYMSAFCRRLVTSPVPSICAPQAYLVLKGIECDRLITLTECLRLGLDPASVI